MSEDQGEIVEVIATVWLQGDIAPTYVLRNGDVLSPKYEGHSLSWGKSTQLTAKVQAGISGSGDAGFNITLLRDGMRIGGLSVAD